MPSPQLSAGLLVYRHPADREGSEVQLLLVHPGGPFWANKDEHAWSIPKGLVEDDEDPEEASLREFAEELGSPAPTGPRIALGDHRVSSKKIVRAWATEGDLDVSHVVSNTFEMEWPPKSGKTATFPEVDRAAWFTLDEAATKLHKGQVPFVASFQQKVLGAP